MSVTVFLADDHAVIRDGLKMLLEAQPDITVIGEASNGRGAVFGVTELRPDVAILDIGMPEINGIEAARMIREARLSTQTIVLSMHSSGEHVYQALQAGVRGYVLKESAGTEVIDAVRRVHSGERYLSQKIMSGMIGDYLQDNKPLAEKDPMAVLSPREREILQLVVEGLTSKEIALAMYLSPKTVDTYRSRLMKKLNLTDVPGLVKFAIQHDLVSLSKAEPCDY